MRSFSIIALAVLSALASPLHALCQDIAHFKEAEIPANERRLSALARVREFRCNYELPQFSQATVLIAEYYKDGKRVDAFLLTHTEHDTRVQDKTGIVSVGWQRDLHNLICVGEETGGPYSPQSAIAALLDFRPMDAFWFKDSAPEPRKSELPAADARPDFTLYPVMGICGARTIKVDYPRVKDRETFLATCKLAGAKDVVLIYLYLVPRRGWYPPMLFTKEQVNE